MFTTASSSLGTSFFAAIATALFAGVCLFGATAPAAAATAPQAMTVSYTDLNVASASGHKALDTRIVRAARSVCANGGRDVRSLTIEARCIDDAVAAARSKVYPTSASAN